MGHTFVIGLLGNPQGIDVNAIEHVCKEFGNKEKEIKVAKKTEVKFDFKEKGSKPVVTKDIMQFSITGDGFHVEKTADLLKS